MPGPAYSGCVPAFFPLCLDYLSNHAMEVEGLFRVPGNMGEIKRLKLAFQTESSRVNLDDYDVHSVGGVVKAFLRELRCFMRGLIFLCRVSHTRVFREPILMGDMYEYVSFLNSQKGTSIEDWAGAVRTIFYESPPCNAVTLYTLVGFLHALCEFSEVNKMTSKNLAIVFGPQVLVSPSSKSGDAMKETQLAGSFMDKLITNWSVVKEKLDIEEIVTKRKKA